MRGGVRKTYMGPERSNGPSAYGLVVTPCTCLAGLIGREHSAGCEREVAELQGQPPVAVSKGWGERPGGGA